jgi:magnesium-transporting ATPase (P-type)
MNLFVVYLNVFSTVLWTSATTFSLVVALLHFFKKETILERIRLNFFEAAFFSLPLAVLFGFFILLSFAQSDSEMFGLSGGSMALLLSIGVVILGESIRKLSDWRGNLPRT